MPSLIPVFFAMEKSTSWNPGEVRMLRPALPKPRLPNAFGLIHCEGEDCLQPQDRYLVAVPVLMSALFTQHWRFIESKHHNQFLQFLTKTTVPAPSVRASG